MIPPAARLPLAAAALLAIMAAAAMAIWRHTTIVAYLWFNVLPPSLWALVGIGLAHWRQMDAHRVTQVGMITSHSAARKAHRDAAAARQIAADLYHAHTGLKHPHAPTEGS